MLMNPGTLSFWTLIKKFRSANTMCIHTGKIHETKNTNDGATNFSSTSGTGSDQFFTDQHVSPGLKIQPVKPIHFLNNIIYPLFWVLISVCSASGSKPIVLTDTLEELWITREYVEYLEDPSSEMTIEEILHLGDGSSRFQKSNFRELINKNTKAAYWLKFKIIHESTGYKPFRIEVFDFDMDEISIYYPDNNRMYKEQKAGFSLPFVQREIGHKNVSFRVPANIPSGAYVYMRFYSKKKNMLEPVLRSYDRLINYALGEYILLGIFYGLLLLMIMYNLIYFLKLRKAYYLYYVLHGCGVLVCLMSRNGTGFQYVWPSFPNLNSYIGETGLFVAIQSILMFAASFLQVQTKAPRLFKVLAAAFFLRILIYAFQLSFWNSYLFDLIDLLYINLVLFIAIRLYRFNSTPAKWVVIAFSILNFSFLITLLEHLTVIPSWEITVYSVNIGIIFEFVFLFIGIAETVKEVYKVKSEMQAKLIQQYEENRALKDKVNRELEQKVHERTAELNKANEDLQQQSEKNYQMSVALDLANNELKKYITQFARISVTKSHLSFEEFMKAYPDEISCIRFLHDLKEKEGFICIKCGSEKSIKGKAKFDMRCARCNYNESLTANTIFHRTKFPLQKAFYMLYLVSQKKGDISASELSTTLGLQTSTCQHFKNRILERIPAKGKNKENEWENLILCRKNPDKPADKIK